MDIIERYLSSVIPEEISKKKKQELRDELTSHILDRADVYRELGADEEESIEKAVKNMGEDVELTQKIKDSFKEIYYEKKIIPVICGLLTLAVINVSFFLNLFYGNVLYGEMSDNIFVAANFICLLFMTILICYARVRDYRKTLITVGAVNLISFFTYFSYVKYVSAILTNNVKYICDMLLPTMINSNVFRAGYTLKLVTLIISGYCFISALRIKRGKAKTHKPVKSIVITVSAYVVSVFLCLFIGEYSEKYVNTIPVIFDYAINVTPMSETVLNKIDENTTREEVESLLAEKGYINVSEYKSGFKKRRRRQIERAVEFTAKHVYGKAEIYFIPVGVVDPETAEVIGNRFAGMLFFSYDKNGHLSTWGSGYCLAKNGYYNEHNLKYLDDETVSEVFETGKGEKSKEELLKEIENISVSKSFYKAEMNGTDKTETVLFYYKKDKISEEANPTNVIRETVFKNGTYESTQIIYETDPYYLYNRGWHKFVSTDIQ